MATKQPYSWINVRPGDIISFRYKSKKKGSEPSIPAQYPPGARLDIVTTGQTATCFGNSPDFCISDISRADDRRAPCIE